MALIPIERYRAVQTRRIRNMRRRSKLTEKEIAQYMASVARKYAPRKSGRLLRGIRRNKNQVSATAIGDEGFPYIHWVNQTHGSGMKTLRVKTPSGKVNMNGRWVRVPGRIMIYGSRPSTWRNWTGRAGFFTHAMHDARKRFPNQVRRRVIHTTFGATVV